MRIEAELTKLDLAIIDEHLKGFLPAQVYDIHAHLIRGSHYPPEKRGSFIPDGADRDVQAYRTAFQRWMPSSRLGTLYFGYPSTGSDNPAINEWMASEVARDAALSRSLYLASPDEDPSLAEETILRQGHIGIKPYSVYAARPDSANATIEEFVPEWMWRICDRINGILMIHIVRDKSIADPDNQKSLRRLCQAYPRCRVVLAHIARSFNYRHALEGLGAVQDLENIWVDTSAITEAMTFRHALDVLGPGRILFGSDFPVSEIRGRCITTVQGPQWLYATEHPGLAEGMTLIGIESLLNLKDACQSVGLSGPQIEQIFFRNALSFLSPFDQSQGAEHSSGRKMAV